GRFCEGPEPDAVTQVRAGDGTRTREISIPSPGWPEAAAGESGAGVPRRWALGDSLVLSPVDRLSAGLERSFGTLLRLNAEYVYEHGASLFRARNLEQDGGRVFEVRAAGRSRAH